MFPYGHPDHTPPEPLDPARLADIDPATLSLDQLDAALDGLEGTRRQTDAARLAILAEYDRRDGHARSGSVSAATELSHRHGGDRHRLRAEMSCARKLPRLPVMAEALAAGSVTADHAAVLARALTDKTAEAMTRDESHLVGIAHRLGVDDFRKAMRHWKAHADPDGTDPDGSLPSEWFLSQSLDGVGFTKGRFDPTDTATISRAVDAMLDEMHHDTNDESETENTPIAQRRAEAVAELIRRGAGLDADEHPHRRTRPQVVVTINHENLCEQLGLGELDTGTLIEAATARRLACDAEILSAVFNTDSELLDLARRSRLVTPAQRAALALRDKGCVFPGCDRPVGWCDAHHIDHWINGGPTDLDNLILMCSKHHHLLHEGRWTVTGTPGTEPLTFTAPTGATHHQRPRPRGHPDPWDPPPPHPDPQREGRPPTISQTMSAPRPDQPRPTQPHSERREASQAAPETSWVSPRAATVTRCTSPVKANGEAYDSDTGVESSWPMQNPSPMRVKVCSVSFGTRP